MYNKTLFTTIVTLSLCLVFQASGNAGVYRWEDADGRVHYGDRPVSSNAEKLNIRIKKPTPVTPESTTDKEKTSGKEAEEKPETAPVEPEVPKISKKDKRKYCNEAKTDIATISSRGRMREVNTKGEYSYLSEKQRQQRLSAARKKQREFCR